MGVDVGLQLPRQLFHPFTTATASRIFLGFFIPGLISTPLLNSTA
jgi:hypothetical protein